MFKYENILIDWLGHDGFKITRAGLNIYIDPYQIKDNDKADIVLITHGHYDHCSVEDISKLIKENTTVIVTADCISNVGRFKKIKLKVVEPGSELDVEGIKIQTIPAYNTNKFRSPGQVFHDKRESWVGYILTLGKIKVYHSGDTDFIPEMKTLNNIDIALVPVSGTYVMTPKEAAEAVNYIRPKVAIPMHYGNLVGSKEDAETFKSLVNEGIKVEIL